MEEVDADKLERGRESRDKEKLHSSRAGWFGRIHLLENQESKGEELWWGQGAQKGLEAVPRCFPSVLLICLLYRQPQTGTLTRPFGDIKSFPAPRTHWPQRGSARDLEVMPALPSRGMCWKLAALTSQFQLGGSPGELGCKIPQFPSQKGCVWYTAGIRCEHTQHSPWSHTWDLITLRKWALSFFLTSPVTSDGQLCLSRALAPTLSNGVENHTKIENQSSCVLQQ